MPPVRADLALVGFGPVGRRFARLLVERAGALRAQYDLECRIVGIATGRHGSIHAHEGLDATAAAEAIESGATLEGLDGADRADSAAAVIRILAEADAPLRVVVENTTLNISNGRPAIDHVEQALDAGCHVVTANKGPAAFAYRELGARASAQGVSFLFESAVMDGIPVFSLVRETLPAVEVRGFRGVLNSTTNHILSALEDGEPFDAALARMQAAGVAEADPSLDVDGWDAAAKAAALANVLLGSRITPHDVRRTGIDPRCGERAADAKRRGARLRLVASARRGEPPIVQPLEVPETDPLAALRGMANALFLETDLLGELAIFQMDGSLTQTAYGLLSDLVTVRRRAAPVAAPPRRTP